MRAQALLQHLHLCLQVHFGAFKVAGDEWEGFAMGFVALAGGSSSAWAEGARIEKRLARHPVRLPRHMFLCYVASFLMHNQSLARCPLPPCPLPPAVAPSGAPPMRSMPSTTLRAANRLPTSRPANLQQAYGNMLEAFRSAAEAVGQRGG